ncbi:MAG: CdaR family protein [Eubacteriales bacterium]
MLDNLSELVIDTLDETKILDNQVKKVPITLPEGVKSVDGVTGADIDIKLTQNAQKKISITNFNVKAPPSGLNYTIEDKNIAITLRGPEALLSHVTLFNIKADIDLSLYAEKGTYNLVPVEITVSSSDGVYALGEYTVTVKIE